jgi:ABC-type multidrug transport system fused ATPase/permease subunit
MTNLPQPPKVINPLWMISLFFSFTEVELGYVVFKTTGSVQVALTAFVIGFPVLIAAAFFALLWFRPENFYAPKDFGSDEAYLRNFADADARRAKKDLINLDAQIEQRIIKTLTSDHTIKRFALSEKTELKETLKDTAADITSEIRETNFISVSLAPIASGLKELNLPVKALATFGDLIDTVFFALEGHVDPYTYGTSWIIRDQKSHKVFKNTRMIKRLRPGNPSTESRTLEAVGIRAGMSLEAAPPNL